MVTTVTLTDLLVWEIDHPSCGLCGETTCRRPSCGCGWARAGAHGQTCGVELGVAG